MRNLRLFILRNYYFFLFLVFEMISISFLVSSNDHQRTTFLNSSNALIGNILTQKDEITQYFHLADENKRLLEENARLKSLLKEYHFEINKGEIHFGDSGLVPQYSFLPAKVINSTVNLQDNFLTLNRGAEDGVRPEMGVANDQGIVGFVKDVSDHFCTVVSALNKNFVLSVKLKRNNEHGLLNWEGTSSSEMVLNGIPVDAKVSTGDTVITRGTSARFPEGILVGRVIRVEREPGAMHHRIIVELAAKFSAVYNVYIIENNFRTEQLELEEKIEEVGEQ